jgi:eukaryotic-like serine/threonine-protein kinase
MAVSLTQDEWRQVLKLSEAVAGLSFAGRLRFLESASISPEIMTHVLELTPADASSLESRYGGEPSPKIHPTSGFRIGRFTTIECLGVGGMGEVWSAHDSSLDRTVALKFFFPGTLAGLSDQVITREARAASALNHPNIVTIHEIVQSENMAALVMELVDGTALRQLVGKPLSESEFLKIGLQIADALTAAHFGGIIHGDIKPENILLRRDGHIKVLDFGLARRIAGESGGIGFVGTLRYMSPEQIEGEHLTPATDIFSLGLVLFELITGKHPFPEKSPVETAKAILTTSPPLPSSINPKITKSLDAFLVRMLARDPAQRPSAKQVAQFLEAVATLQNGDTSSDRAVARAESPDVVDRSPSRLWKGSRKAVWIGVLLILVAIFAWLAFFKTRKPAPLPELTIYPLTAQPGWEYRPALSPDGKSVAFTWTGDLTKALAVYLKRFDSEAPVLLFRPPPNETIGALAWSPDNSKLAFKIESGQARAASR